MSESATPGYQILGQLGKGMGGAVFLARRESDGTDVALKLPDLARPGEEAERARVRFVREARVLLDHPHPCLVPALEARLEGDDPYLALPYLAGGDLVPYTREGNLLPLPRVVAIGRRLADALAHLHAHEVLHRDVKPANVMLDEDGHAYLGDLGLGKTAEDAGLTATGEMVGTPAYLSPERWRGEAASVASDLYSLGVVLLELVTGRRPELVNGEVEFDWEGAHRLERSGMRGLLRRCLRSRPADRPADAAEVRDALAGMKPDRGPRPAPPARRTASPKPTAHPRRWPILPLLAGLMLGVLGSWTWRRLTAPRPAPPMELGALDEDRLETETWTLALPPSGTTRPRAFVDGKGAVLGLPRNAGREVRWWTLVLDGEGRLLWSREDSRPPRVADGEEVTLAGESGIRLSRESGREVAP